ncbi:hypothetical protein C8J55DRAFT_487521 [Lentinula edodes]|uniref:Uncharacterized protein n=1 Tax=Lentinula lateritia TaxID=40482 RepID=A0A9W9AP97_9AGAR|nr:hypothetical protein C8J55DRAFT_487521 [Lentinula edodes]
MCSNKYWYIHPEKKALLSAFAAMVSASQILLGKQEWEYEQFSACIMWCTQSTQCAPLFQSSFLQCSYDDQGGRNLELAAPEMECVKGKDSDFWDEIPQLHVVYPPSGNLGYIRAKAVDVRQDVGVRGLLHLDGLD